MAKYLSHSNKKFQLPFGCYKPAILASLWLADNIV